jgi:hypothetical protein
MTLKIRKYKNTVQSLAAILPDKSDAEWLVAIYLSLGTAEELGYKEDSYARLDRKTRNEGNADMLSKDSLQFPASSDITKKWLAGHYFNNALFRMVALSEISLRTLFYREAKMSPNLEPPINYWWLVDWYEGKFERKLKYIHKARRRVNKFKHDPRERQGPKALETLGDGFLALEELLLLMSVLATPPELAEG